MQEIPKDIINEIRKISEHCDSLQDENYKLRLEVQALRSLLHSCTCIPGTKFDGRDVPMEKL